MTEAEKAALLAHTRRTYDEVCRCGHLRSEHEDTLAWGHGDCTHLGINNNQDCGCMKFTFVRRKTSESNQTKA